MEDRLTLIVTLTQETLGSNEERRAVRLAQGMKHHRALSEITDGHLDHSERYVRSLAENIEGHLNTSDFYLLTEHLKYPILSLPLL